MGAPVRAKVVQHEIIAPESAVSTGLSGCGLFSMAEGGLKTAAAPFHLQTKLAASFLSPAPLYQAFCG